MRGSKTRAFSARANKAAAGFTLLEVVVAFVILGLAFAAAFEVFSTGFRNVRVTGDYAEAVLLAQSKLAQLGVAEPIVEGATEGSFEGGYRWRLEVRPVSAALVPDTSDEEEDGGPSEPGTEAEPGAMPGPAAPSAPAEPVRDMRLVALALTVSWGEPPGRSLTLDTYRLVEATDQ